MALVSEHEEHQRVQAMGRDLSRLHQVVLDEAKMGYLMLGSDARVIQGYAPRCATAFGVTDLAGVDYADLMLPGQPEEDKQQVRTLIANLVAQGSNWRTESLFRLLPDTCEREGNLVGSGTGSPDSRDLVWRAVFACGAGRPHRAGGASFTLSREHERLKMVVAVLIQPGAFAEFWRRCGFGTCCSKRRRRTSCPIVGNGSKRCFGTSTPSRAGFCGMACGKRPIRSWRMNPSFPT
jgi:hypothetical protein